MKKEFDHSVFFPELVTKTEFRTKPTQEDRGCAALLMRALTNNKVRKDYLSISAYAQEIRKLRQSHDIDNDEITITIKWLALHALEKFTPKVWNAKGFRIKYIAIRYAMERTRLNAPVKLDEEGKKILANLNIFIWKKTSQEELTMAIGCSVLNLRAVKKITDARLKELRLTPRGLKIGSKDRTEDMQRVLARIRDTIFGETIYTITQHFKLVWRSKHNWADWNGKVSSNIWKPQEKGIDNAILAEIAKTFTGKTTGVAYEYITEMLNAGEYRG